MSLTNKVAQFDADSDLVNAWVHGPASGAGSTVITVSGAVRTPAKLIADNEAELQAVIDLTSGWANGNTTNTAVLGGMPVASPAKLIADKEAEINIDAAGVLALSTAQAVISTTQAGIATTQAGLATTNGAAQVTLATTEKTAAVAAKTAAELAAVNALISAGSYTTEALGRAAVADGAAFKVQGSGDVAAYEYRRTDSTTSVLIATYPSVAAMAPLIKVAPIGYAWSVVDGDLVSAIGVKDDGTFVANNAEMASATITSLTMAGTLIDDQAHAGFALVFADPAGNAPIGIKNDGTFSANAIEVDTINGQPYGSAVDRSGGAYPYQIAFVNNMGESLAEGSTGTAITTAQEYDSLCYPAHATSPGALLPMTVATGQYSARGENPMFGAAAHYKALISKENGLSYLANDFQLLGCNNGYSGYKLAQHIKGTAPYTAMISQVQSLKDYGTATGKTVGVLSTDMTTGANDGNPADLTATATFKAQLIQNALDIDTDVKAITGQTRPAIMVVGQVSSRAPQLAAAMLEASNESPLIFVACPMYSLTYYDSLHINPASERILGAYYGLVKKRVITDGVDWEPLQPMSHIVVGTSVYIRFNKTGLAFDTALVSAQTRYGFDAIDGGGAAVALSGDPVIVGRDTVRFDFATLPAKIRAAHNVSAGRADTFVGGSCNLRDSAGYSLIFDSTPLHNWCAIFSYTL